MTTTCTILIFALNTLNRLDILAWVVGLPLLLAASVWLYRQLRQNHKLKTELAMLGRIKIHPVEYDLVMRAMKLAVFRLDLVTQSFTIDTDYRDALDSLNFPPGTGMDEIYKYMLPEYVENVRNDMRALIEGRLDIFHQQLQLRLPHSDQTYWLEGYATADTRDAQGRPLSVVGTLMRIDRQKEIENALKEAVFHAEESDRLKSAFLANISHEIRTPLNAIVGFSEVLPMVEDGEERQNLVEVIRKNNNHLLRLFDSIVTMSKLEARGGGVVHRTTFHLKDIFAELVGKYKEQSVNSDIPVVVASDSLLPVMTTDRDRLLEVLSQYLNNALKFTSAGSITMGCSDHDDMWRIWVRDTGKGIPADKCNDHLFDRFAKVDEFVPGMGLGLSICKSMALSMGGSVGVESEEGKGSTFWIDMEKK